ncbi:MAG: cytochrome c-type biogenesis protein CcmH [Actinomycetota bacterium]|nr:cytochrome c-type biogenesis protein CcmH [Actinomycetota bacterium]
MDDGITGVWSRRRGLRFVALVLVAVIGFSGIASAAPTRTSLPEIEDEVMCPICGTLLSLSHAPAAERQRVFIRKLIAQGQSKDQIKDALVAEYGGQVLAMPENRGIDVWAYLVPVIGFGLALIGVIWTVVRWRQRRDGGDGSDPSGPGPGTSPDGAGDEDRLDRDMARFDL